MRPTFFVFKMIPKRIVYYSIANHSSQLVLLYLQNLQHEFFIFNFIAQFMFISKASVSSSSSVDSVTARSVTLRLFFVFIHF